MITPLKRTRSELCSRSPGAGKTVLSEDSWIQYDVDVLDSIARRRKRAAAEVMSQELFTKLQVLEKSVDGISTETCATGLIDKGAESMHCSSAESSPAPTPHRGVCITPSTSKVYHAMPTAAARPRLAQKPTQLGEQMPTSPSDPQLEGIDLRKATLMRQLMLRAGADEGEMHTEATPVRTAQLSRHVCNDPIGPVSPMRPFISLHNFSPLALTETAPSHCFMDVSHVNWTGFLLNSLIYVL